jgi:protocatechuate 3,4-dioxygenase beta subunit
MKKKYLLISLTVIIMVISINCAFAEDTDSANIGTANDNTASLNDKELTSTHSISLETNEVNIDVDNELKISGIIKDKEGNLLSDSDVNISIDSIPYGDNEKTNILQDMIKSDSHGSYSFNYKPTIGELLNIKVINPYTLESNNTEVKVNPKSTIVSLNPSYDMDVGQSINITGRLTDRDGKILRYTGVGVLIEEIPYGDSKIQRCVKEYTRTDNDGYYSYEYKTTLAGKFYITTYYPGYHYYGFNYSKNELYVYPNITSVSVKNVKDICEGENIRITGTLTDYYRNPLRNSYVGMLFNGKNKTYVKTDDTGTYNYNYTPPHSGYWYITVYYPGYHNYGFNKCILNFYVNGSDIIAIDPVKNCSYGETIILSGKCSHENKPYKNVRLEINVKHQYNIISKINTKTDEEGRFSVEYKPPLSGKKTVNIFLYNNPKITNSTTFNVEGIKTRIELEPINKTYSHDDRVIVRGRLVDENNTPITLGNEYIIHAHSDADTIAPTDEDGKFMFNLPALDAGEYKIIDVSFNLYKIFDLTTFIPEYEPCSAGLSYYVNEIE